MTALGVQLPYLAFAGVFILLAVLIKFTHLPQFISHEQVEKGMGALKYPHLVLGMIAISCTWARRSASAACSSIMRGSSSVTRR